MSPKRHAAAPTTEGFKPSQVVSPNFCSGETLLRVFILVMLLALVVLLLTYRGSEPMAALFPISMFIAWVAFSSLLLLCLLQPVLYRLPLLWQVIVPPVIPVLNTALVHWGAEQAALANSDERLRVVAITLLLSLIAMRYFYLVAAWKEETRLVAQAREQALRARVRPHFLFNSMNSIAGLCRTDPARAEQVTLDLADLFRATFGTGATHSLREELELARTYLNIEQTRFGDRLQVEWDVPDGAYLKLPVPALVLQPLVENAVQHGIAPNRNAGRVRVKAGRAEGRTVIEIANTIGDHPGTGTQTATAEIRARLRHCFGDKASLETRRSPEGFLVRCSLPAHHNPPSDRP